RSRPRSLGRFAGGLLCLVMTALAVSVARADDSALQSITAMAQAGARQLALERMDRLQPDPAQDPVGWMNWEHERIYILQGEQDWAGVVSRVRHLPQGLPADFVRWARTQAAAADLKQGHGQDARRLLRGLIWSPGGASDPETFAHWRRMVIRSYLLDGRVKDARSALARYRQDYGEQDGESRLLQARVALLSGHPDDAATLLVKAKGHEARALELLARLRSAAVAPAKVYARAAGLAAKATKDPAGQADLWAAAAAAARAAGDRERLITALEHCLAVMPAGGHDPLLEPSADALWTAYLDYGHYLGNNKQLLVGKDDQWYFAATDALKSDPVKARALFAVLAFTTRDPARRNVAHEYLASMVSKLPHGARLLARLYLHSKRFPDPHSLPLPVRYRLVDYALGRSELTLASHLMAGLDQPPEGTDPLNWQLRRARVLIRANQVAAGTALLDKVLKQHPDLDKTALDRFVQVVFDLQTVERQRDAIRLLKELLKRDLPQKRRRELLFWTADSYNALHRYKQAGALYLESAIVKSPFAMDPWAQTARYHAAGALAKAGLDGDARRLYQGLLNATHDPSRRMVLRHQIDQLLDAPRVPDGTGAARGTSR
ncbi:MAG: hypothetical protein P8124_07540, partial [Gammaproteobacteria bacterium]